MNEPRPLLLSTMDEPAGMLIIAVLGIVVGTEARAMNPFLDGVKRLLPNQERDFPIKLANSRLAAVARMVTNARELGANAVLGVRFDHRSLSPTWIELCAYGTAVRLGRTGALDPPAAPGQRQADHDMTAEFEL